MKIGVASIFLREHPLLGGMGSIASAGYAGVEVWVDHMRVFGEDPGAIRRRAAELGLCLTMHAPHYDLNPLSSNPAIRRESRAQLLASLELAAELETEVAVIHPGHMSASWETADMYFPKLLEFAGDLGRRAHELGVTACVELMERRGKEFFQTPEDADRLMALDVPGLGVTVDIAHLYTLDAPEGEAGVMKRINPDWIRHVHLSDSGPGATHMLLGKGRVDIAGTLAALPGGYQGMIMVEGYVPGRGGEVILENMNYLKGLSITP